MTSLERTLGRYIGTGGELGDRKLAKPSTRIAERAALTRALEDDLRSTRHVLWFWMGLNGLAFLLLLVAASLHLADPFVSVPAGVVGIFWLLRRVELVLREFRRLQLALGLLQLSPDEATARKVMGILYASLCTPPGHLQRGTRPELAATGELLAKPDTNT